jgi:S-adenosylmethionine hydrolase
MARPVITFLTDFGLDGAAAICRGVMLGIAPDAQIIDIAHGVGKYAIRDGAYLLRTALPWMPVGVHVGVVDPGVGTARRPIAIQVRRGDILVGPDNGLLVPAALRLGGIAEVRELDNPAWAPAERSATFHGRDLFAPVAAKLATGADFQEVGPTLDPDGLVRLAWPEPVVAPGELATTVVYTDSFGNLRLAGARSDLETALGALSRGAILRLSASVDGGPEVSHHEARWATTFGEVPRGGLLAYIDSSGDLAIAVAEGSAARALGLGTGASIRIERG